LALDVYQGKDVEAQKVIVWKKHNGANQRWRVVYVDKSKKEATSGFSKEWGFYINRPLYFRSYSQCRELLNLSELMLDSEDITFQERDNRLGNSILHQRPSSLCIIPDTQWILQTAEEVLISDLLQPTQDGGRCSE
jgi:hypothetical protein